MTVKITGAKDAPVFVCNVFKNTPYYPMALVSSGVENTLEFSNNPVFFISASSKGDIYNFTGFTSDSRYNRSLNQITFWSDQTEGVSVEEIPFVCNTGRLTIINNHGTHLGTQPCKEVPFILKTESTSTDFRNFIGLIHTSSYPGYDFKYWKGTLTLSKPGVSMSFTYVTQNVTRKDDREKGIYTISTEGKPNPGHLGFSYDTSDDCELIVEAVYERVAIPNRDTIRISDSSGVMLYNPSSGRLICN
jgi:hypothetical protein